jgi:hypothetical protein
MKPCMPWLSVGTYPIVSCDEEIAAHEMHLTRSAKIDDPATSASSAGRAAVAVEIEWIDVQAGFTLTRHGVADDVPSSP